jgi:hypothetical protein
MLIRICLTLCLVALISCKSSNQGNQKQDLYKSNSRPDITGIWTSGETENATFQIDKDSIFYVDALQRFKYQVVGDSLIINFADADYRCRIAKATKDSLVWIKDGNRTAFWRFKN